MRYHAVTQEPQSYLVIHNCWTALDSKGRRGPVYEDLDATAIETLTSTGYNVEEVDRLKIDEKGY